MQFQNEMWIVVNPERADTSAPTDDQINVLITIIGPYECLGYIVNLNKPDLELLLVVSESWRVKESGSLFAEYREVYMLSQIEESL